MIDNVKIMVVDDDTMIRKLTVTALTYCVNRKVLSFDTGVEAWNYLQSGGEADLVISDVDMPGMDGFELLAKVKTKFPDKIFIITSGVREYEKRSRKEGADAFLAKPFEISDLFSLVQCFVVQ
jgi:CheY-like chemotaxis protein